MRKVFWEFRFVTNFFEVMVVIRLKFLDYYNIDEKRLSKSANVKVRASAGSTMNDMYYYLGEQSHYENIATFSDKSEVVNNRTVRIY